MPWLSHFYYILIGCTAVSEESFKRHSYFLGQALDFYCECLRLVLSISKLLHTPYHPLRGFFLFPIFKEKYLSNLVFSHTLGSIFVLWTLWTLQKARCSGNSLNLNTNKIPTTLRFDLLAQE